ncbi:L-threonylcarbamoyladenylate synthase [Deferrisoma camini]|uniref:L-threonylcarbamoyladenylate synthase n=1 Tax=Deferrisoma camini TaxID=1035120 RepID=UPI0004B8B97D|nr:L-threonylcarbamoyladenylate synthase [Deferrisoma camini]
MAVMLSVHPVTPQARHVRRAADVLRNDGVIVYPTDTVYGLGCDITKKHAVERIVRIKGRDPKKPMSFVCADLTHISRYARVSNFAYRILKRFLPGPYTFVLEASREVPRLLLTKQKTVGIRIPDHPVCLGLVKELGNPILSTSANPSGADPLNRPEEIQWVLGSQVDLILECGVLPRVPSTVVSLVGERVRVLREGAGDASFFRELEEAG